jgi:hypothetical protein
MESDQPLEHPFPLRFIRRIAPATENIRNRYRPGLSVQIRHIVQVDKWREETRAKRYGINRCETASEVTGQNRQWLFKRRR